MRTLVAVDLSPASNAALRDAALRQPKGEPLAVCHVIPNVGAIRPLFPHLASAENAELSGLAARAEEAVRRNVEEITGLTPPAYDLFVDEGIDYAEIVRRAEEWKADRVVVGASGAGGLARLLGTVAERVVRYAPCAVLCVRSREPASSSGAVIAATDLSAPSVPAIAEAAREAKLRGAPLVVAHALDFGNATVASVAFAPLVTTSLVPASAIETAKNLARDTIAAHLEALGAQGEVVVLDGPAASAIARLAEERAAGLVVVATRGRTGFARLALGSVAERIVHGAPCDVLAVRLERG